MRRIVLGCALVALAGCGLVTPPPPPGTVLVQLNVRNGSPVQATLEVDLPSGAALEGAVQPPILAPGASADVAFHVPVSGAWTIAVNGQDLILSTDMRGRRGVIEDVGIEVVANGMVTFLCKNLCP